MKVTVPTPSGVVRYLHETAAEAEACTGASRGEKTVFAISFPEEIPAELRGRTFFVRAYDTYGRYYYGALAAGLSGGKLTPALSPEKAAQLLSEEAFAAEAKRRGLKVSAPRAAKPVAEPTTEPAPS